MYTFFLQVELMETLDDGHVSGSQVLERLMCYLISPSYLPQVSWTGRGKGKERKFSLSACSQLINFIVIVVKNVDERFNYRKVVAELTYGLLKRALSKFGKKASDAKKNSAPIAEEHVENTVTVSNPVSESNCALITTHTSSGSDAPAGAPLIAAPLTATSPPASLPTSSSSSYQTFNQNYTKEQFNMFMQPRIAANGFMQPMSWWDSRYQPYVPPPGPSLGLP